MRLPDWVGDRRFVVVSDSRPLAAFYVKEEAERYIEHRDASVYDREKPG